MIQFQGVGSVADWVQTGISVIALLIALAGLIYVARQIWQVNRSLRLQANAVLSEQSLTILSFIADHPRTYPYLYAGKNVAAEHDSDVVVEVNCACEMIANYCDLTIEACPDVGPVMQDRWLQFIADTARDSPALVSFVQGRSGWYSDALMAKLGISRPTSQ